MSSSEIKPSSYELMSSISNQLSGYGGIPSGCGSSINGRKLPEGTSSNGAGASSTSPSGNSSSSFNSHSNLHSNSHLNSSSPSSYHHSSYYAASAAAASPAELAMYGHLNAFTSHHHRNSHHHSSSLNKPKAKARSNAGKTEYLNYLWQSFTFNKTMYEKYYAAQNAILLRISSIFSAYCNHDARNASQIIIS